MKSGKQKPENTMQEINPMRHFEKITRVYSERREQEIAIRVRYDVSADNGCKVVELRNIQEFSH